MIPEIKNTEEIKLIGLNTELSINYYQIGELWKCFMPRRKEITNCIHPHLYSISDYPENYFLDFNPATSFTKWAALGVRDFNTVPQGMQAFTIPSGLYAIFHYKGLSNDFSIFNYIFKTWLPNSEYDLDHRPHFELLGEKYKNNDPDSEEDLWIPIKKR